MKQFLSHKRLVAVVCLVIASLLIIGYTLPSRKTSADASAILRRADDMAWLNDWFGAAPYYSRAEKMFIQRGDAKNALYAHVSQLAPQIETVSMPSLIAEINDLLKRSAANAPEVRLRILTVKGMAELNYDAATARKTWHEVEVSAKQQHEYRLASRASGEQGILAFLLGDISDAKSRVTRAYTLSRVLNDPAARVRYASVFGSALVELHRYKESFRWLDEAISIAEHTPGMAQPTIAYNAKVDAVSALGRTDEARKIAEKALQRPRARNLLGQQYAVLTNLAQVLQRQGEWSKAISDYSEGLQYARQLSYWRGLTESGGKLAQAYEHQGDFKVALAAVDEALEANKKIPEELYFMPKNLSIKAEIETKLGHKKEAEALYLKSADLIDVMLANSPTPNVERILIADLGYVYGDQFKLISDQRNYGKAFEVIEKARGRIETQSLEHHSAPRPHDRTPTEMKLNALQVQLIDTDESKKRKSIMDEIYQTEVQQLDNGAIGTRAYAEPVTTQHLQRELRPDELLIEYVLQSPQSYALAVTCTSIERYSLPDKDVIESQAADYLKVIRDKKQQPDLAQRLFVELLADIPEYKEKTAVIVIPDGKLHLLPFSSLMDEKGNYAIVTHTISTAPSGTVLSLLRDRSIADTHRKPYLGVAAWTETTGNPGIFREILGGPSRAQLEPLPESRSEVESIGAMLPKPSTILLGSAATKDRFEQLPLNEYEVVHLALHGYVDPEFPDRSALVFAPLTSATSSDAGFLQVRDILRLHLDASLVTLSACDTGVGPVGEEGVDNVVEAFIQAGARSVVSTLWELEDRSTTHLMKDFYDHLTRGENKAEALRNAQVDLLHENASPYYWASFEVVGDPSGNLYPRTNNDTL